MTDLSKRKPNNKDLEKQVDKLYESESNLPTDAYGSCPECGEKQSKVIWGWHGIYYALLCPNGHQWTYKFKSIGEQKK